MKKKSKELSGVLDVYSEIGNAGGFWAFQNEKFIQKNVPCGYCKKCDKRLAEQEYDENLKVEIVLLPEATSHQPKYCKDGEHEMDIDETWDYEGLEKLENGDMLIIYNPENLKEVVWKGKISLKQFNLFTEHASGYWIHAEQRGVDRETWAKYFFENYPAKLTKRTRK